MQRRQFLVGTAAAAGALAMPHVGRAAGSSVLKFVPQADLATLDPVWTTSYQTRDHGFMVYDTLFGMDNDYNLKPQMLEGAVTGNDDKLWTMKLRDGLKFHDGEPVLARDCVASILRWSKRDSYGQAIAAAMDEISAPDDKTIVIKLKYAFPLLPMGLGKTSPSICVIMPERLAKTDAFTQVKEVVGSGPFKFKASERVPGSLVVWEKNQDYVPRDGEANGTTGGKVVHFDRIEWHIIPDSSTMSAALQQGEIDWVDVPSNDLVPLLAKSKGVSTRVNVPTGTIATMRFNQLLPPFDNAAMRRAIIGAVNQAEYMTAVMGDDRSGWRDKVGYFAPNTPMANDAGMEALTSPRNLDKVKKELEAAGYKGERVVLLDPQDIDSVKALAAVTNDMLKKIGVNVDAQAMDWATLVQRRASKAPLDKGGWSIFQTSWAGIDHANPVGNVFLRGNGDQAQVGWPTAPKLESLRDQWIKAPNLAEQKRLAREIQLQAFQDVPYIPLGQVLAKTAYRSDLTGMLYGSPLFWNIKRD
jgi:peptide/nickel transport system substrate-binding protein